METPQWTRLGIIVQYTMNMVHNSMDHANFSWILPKKSEFDEIQFKQELSERY